MGKKQGREVVGGMSEWAGMLSDFFRQIKDGTIGLEQMRAIVGHPYSSLIADWQNFYHGTGIETDFSNLRIPERQLGFDRLIIMAQGLTPQLLYDKCAKLFPCWKWTDKGLDEVIDFSFQARSAKNGAYAIWLRDRVEADEELKNLSANDLKRQGIPGITLEERLIFDFKYFKETGKHMDVTNWTLCSGSRCSGGSVPGVGWRGGELCVGWYVPGDASGSLRSRQVVS